MVTEKEHRDKLKPMPDSTPVEDKSTAKADEASTIDYMQLAQAARWLRFPGRIEKEFITDYYNSTISTTRFAFIAGFTIYAVFGFLDIYTAPLSLKEVYLIRFGIGCPTLVLVVLATFVKRLAPVMQLLACIAATIGGLGIVMIIKITEPQELANAHYYVGIILLMLFTSAWLRLRFWYAFIVNTIVIISYEWVAIYDQGLLADQQGELLFLSNNFMIIGAYLIGLFTCYSLERHTRVDFLQRRTIEAERNKSNAQRIEIEKQANKLAKAIASLKKTQTMLIHTEKMASLGELIAGIAHEIKNPLNFVNNFSELSVELINDLEKELETGNGEEITALAESIRENLEKIRYHGQRADSIVKSMLQHSRKGTGQKEPTDINALIDEYLRLSYQGLRAKDKNFNTRMETNFDSSIGKIDIVAQDIGRVLLNLFNNAFYSVNEKKKGAGDSYQPVVSVDTKKTNDMIYIRVRDNGLGIPQSVMDKIYHPFFTTKPAGEGVGLGLSLSYDIITKGHGGTMNVETKEGEFAEFTIGLPA